MRKRELTNMEAQVVAACDQYVEETGVESGFDRRTFVRLSLLSSGLLAGAGLLAACGGSDPASSATKSTSVMKPTGKLYGYTTAYFSKPAMYADFSSQYKTRPEWTAFARAEEQIPKIQQNPGSWDVCMTSGSRAQVWMDSGVLQPWDTSRMPHYQDLYGTFKDNSVKQFGGKPFEVPFFWGRDSVAYNTDHIDAVDGQKIASLFDSKYKGKIAMQNSASESFAVAGLHLGVAEPFRMSDAELAEAKKLLISQKKLIRTYWTEPGELAGLFSSGEVLIGWAWPPVVTMAKDTPIEFVPVPDEGGIAWTGGLGLTKNAKNLYEAHMLADWLLTAPALRWMADNTNNASTSKASEKELTSDELTHFALKPSPEKLLSRLHFQDYVYKADKIQSMWQEVQTS